MRGHFPHQEGWQARVGQLAIVAQTADGNRAARDLIEFWILRAQGQSCIESLRGKGIGGNAARLEKPGVGDRPYVACGETDDQNLDVKRGVVDETIEEQLLKTAARGLAGLGESLRGTRVWVRERRVIRWKAGEVGVVGTVCDRLAGEALVEEAKELGLAVQVIVGERGRELRSAHILGRVAALYVR